MSSSSNAQAPSAPPNLSASTAPQTTPRRSTRSTRGKTARYAHSSSLPSGDNLRRRSATNRAPPRETERAARHTQDPRTENGATQLQVISERRHASAGEHRRYKRIKSDGDAEMLLLYVGRAAQEAKKVLEAIGTKNAPSLIWEMAKLAGSKRTRMSYDWERALSEEESRKNPRMQKKYDVEYFKERYPGEKVLRVWVPEDPNENPDLGPITHLRTKHHFSRDLIQRIVEDQLENTEQVFATMQTPSTGNYGMLQGCDDQALKHEKMHHSVLALRLEGIEVTHYHAKGEYERVEVFFEDPQVKMGKVTGDPENWKWWRQVMGHE